MSFSEALIQSTQKIASHFIDTASLAVPISSVTNLQTNLNTLQSEIDAIPASNFAEFYALMPADNAAQVAVGSAVLFPQNGPTSGSIARSSTSQFVLPLVGTYDVFFQVSVSEAGQLALDVNGVILAKSVVGRNTLTSQIVCHTLVTTVAVNSILRVINPAGNAAALTITASAGGTHAVSANLLIKQVA